jgi:hypothetical protein
MAKQSTMQCKRKIDAFKPLRACSPILCPISQSSSLIVSQALATSMRSEKHWTMSMVQVWGRWAFESLTRHPIVWHIGLTRFGKVPVHGPRILLKHCGGPCGYRFKDHSDLRVWVGGFDREGRTADTQPYLESLQFGFNHHRGEVLDTFIR